jgi:hypothetical protein
MGAGRLGRLLGLPGRIVRRIRALRRGATPAEPAPSMVGRKHEPTTEPSPEEKARRHRRRAKSGLLLWLRDGPGVAPEADVAARAASVYFLDAEAWALLLAEMRAEDLIREEVGGFSVSDAGRSYAEGTH